MFVDDTGEACAKIDVDLVSKAFPINSQGYRDYLMNEFFYDKGFPPAQDSLECAIKFIGMLSRYSRNVKNLSKRVARDNGAILVNLTRKDGKIVNISENSVVVHKASDVLFMETKAAKEQVIPNLDSQPEELLGYVKNHFRLKSEGDINLLTVLLASYFIPEINKPLLIVTGEKGSTKSSALRKIMDIVDPCLNPLSAIPSKREDLMLALRNKYMIALDNLSGLSLEMSNLLCMAITGGALPKRTLYTNTDETIVEFKGNILINGINNAASMPDLLDRSILIELDRVPASEYLTENEVWKRFSADLPNILGSIFNTLAQAMMIYKDVKLKTVGRMADFSYWGFAIAEVIGIGGDTFVNEYISNQNTVNAEAIASNPVAAAILALMKKQKVWEGKYSTLLERLEDIAEEEHIDIRSKAWAKDPNTLGKRLKEVKSNLLAEGVSYVVKNAGNHKIIALYNDKPNS